METYWPARDEQQQKAWALLCANFYEDGLFVCGKEGMKIVATGPHEATIECFGPSGRQRIYVDPTAIDPCLLLLTDD